MTSMLVICDLRLPPQSKILPALMLQTQIIWFVMYIFAGVILVFSCDEFLIFGL